MLLLVIGLVAVIIAVLVTVFLVRRGRADDDEPGGRQAVRDRLRGRDSRLSTDPRAARKPAGRGAALSARPAGEPRGYGGPGRGYEPAASTSPAVTSHRRAAMARVRAAAATRSAPSAWRRCAGAGAIRMHRSLPRWSAPGHHAPPRRLAALAWPPIPAPGPRFTTQGLPPGISRPRAPTPTRTWPIQTSSPGCGRTSRRRRPRRKSRPGRRTRARAVAGRPVAGTTTMTTTGRAPSGTSSPTSSTGPNCPPTAPSRPRPAPRTPARQRSPPRRRSLPGPLPSRRRPVARRPGPSQRWTPRPTRQAGASPPTVPAGRVAARAHPGGRAAPTPTRAAPTRAAPTRAALAWPTGLGPRRPRNSCRSGTAARLRPTLCRPAPHRTCPRPASRTWEAWARPADCHPPGPRPPGRPRPLALRPPGGPRPAGPAPMRTR